MRRGIRKLAVVSGWRKQLVSLKVLRAKLYRTLIWSKVANHGSFAQQSQFARMMISAKTGSARPR